MINTLHYSNQFPPFVFRRETSVEGAADEKSGAVEGKPGLEVKPGVVGKHSVEGKHSTTLVEVVALDLPQRIRGELKQASYIKTTQKLPNRRKSRSKSIATKCRVASWPTGPAKPTPPAACCGVARWSFRNTSVPSTEDQPQPMSFRRPAQGSPSDGPAVAARIHLTTDSPLTYSTAAP